MWEGGVRSQTFLHWSGFSAQTKGTVYSGLAHVVDWGVTLTAALGYVAQNDTGATTAGAAINSNGDAIPIPPLDGLNLWPALLSGGASPRTEMLLSMRDASECAAPYPECPNPGQLAYRKGAYKLIYGHTALRGAQGDQCAWSAAADVASASSPRAIANAGNAGNATAAATTRAMLKGTELAASKGYVATRPILHTLEFELCPFLMCLRTVTACTGAHSGVARTDA